VNNQAAMPHPTCPTESELLAYIAGTLPGGRESAVDEHMMSCASCRSRAEKALGVLLGDIRGLIRPPIIGEEEFLVFLQALSTEEQDGLEDVLWEIAARYWHVEDAEIARSLRKADIRGEVTSLFFRVFGSSGRLQ